VDGEEGREIRAEAVRERNFYVSTHIVEERYSWKR